MFKDWMLESVMRFRLAIEIYLMSSKIIIRSQEKLKLNNTYYTYWALLKLFWIIPETYSTGNLLSIPLLHITFMDYYIPGNLL